MLQLHELGKQSVKEKDCGKCEKNEKELTALKCTDKSMKNAFNTSSINMVNSENINEQSMRDGIVQDVLKTLSAEKINDESADKKLEILIKDVENLKTENSKLEKEVTTPRHGVYN